MRLLIGSQERSRDREEWENADWTGLAAGLSGFSQRYQYAGHTRRLQNRTIASEAPGAATGTHALRPDVAAHCHW